MGFIATQKRSDILKKQDKVFIGRSHKRKTWHFLMDKRH